MATRTDGLFNDTTSSSIVLAEKPEHRVIIILKSQGFSNIEIATFTQYTREHVGNVLRQPWARARLLDLLKEKQNDPAEAFLRGAVMDSLATLVEVRDDQSAGGAARITAANALLDRYLGKPLQRVESKNTHVVDTDNIDDELRRLEAEEATLLGRSPNSPRS